MRKFLLGTMFLAICLCSEAHAFTCYIVKPENGRYAFKSYIEFIRNQNQEGLLKIYGNPDEVINFSYYECSPFTQAGIYCSKHAQFVDYRIEVFKKDNDYFVTAYMYGANIPTTYFLKNDGCTLTGAN